MRGDTHAGCGERSGETGPWQHRHRAPDRLNMVNGATPACLIAVFHLVWRRQLFARSMPPRVDNTAGACGSLSRPASRRAKTCTTTCGSGTIRRPARVFGAPTTILPSTSGAERRTYSRRARKSTSPTRRPTNSDQRRPV